LTNTQTKQPNNRHLILLIM